MKIIRHTAEQDVDNDGNVTTFCGICGKDWGYYNRKYKLLNFRMWLHSLRFKIIK